MKKCLAFVMAVFFLYSCNKVTLDSYYDATTVENDLASLVKAGSLTSEDMYEIKYFASAWGITLDDSVTYDNLLKITKYDKVYIMDKNMAFNILNDARKRNDAEKISSFVDNVKKDSKINKDGRDYYLCKSDKQCVLQYADSIRSAIEEEERMAEEKRIAEEKQKEDMRIAQEKRKEEARKTEKRRKETEQKPTKGRAPNEATPEDSGYKIDKEKRVIVYWLFLWIKQC